MSLERALANVTTLLDLRHLAQALGFTSRPTDASVLAAPAFGASSDHCSNPRRSPSLVPVAQVGDFTWLAAEAADPVATAGWLTRRMAARGRVGGLLILDPARRRLVVAVAFGSRPVLSIDLAAPDAIAVATLARLAPASNGPDGGRLGYAARVADALAAERVGHRFFRQFRTTLTAMAAGLPPAVRGADRHDFALLQLTRVLFLYFVQTKGWLAGQTRFVGDAVDRCLARGRRVHRDFLRPLFFGTLNRQPAERSRAARAFGAIPFLNGGLFEPHPLERRYRVDLPNHLWRDAFDQLFEGFHFTVAERDRQGAVAPDMLGRVFEGVMDPDVRRSTGTFYTPAALVERVIERALVHHAASRLACGTDVARRRLGNPDADVATVLDTITILDPAVGSGAFLLGALERLATLSGPPSSARKRRILQRNLFGVDRNATAVRLTELRLWLAVIADDPSERGDEVAPLPNLDCLVRQGDSLFDPVSGRTSGRSDASGRPRAAELASLRAAVVAAFGPRKQQLVRELRVAELGLLTESTAYMDTQLRHEIATCLADARAPDLFGRRRGLDRALREQLHDLRTSLRGIRRARRLIGAGEVPWFHYQSQFADIFAGAGGFDLIVGNPPWQRAESIPVSMRRALTARYRWWRSGGGYGNRPDLAIAFLERALELAAPGGTVAMLVPAKVASAGYGTAARHALAVDSTLHVVADLSSDRDATFDATVYPLALIATKRSPPCGHRVRTTLDDRHSPAVRQTALSGGAPWLLLSDRPRRVIAALRSEHPRLDECFTCHLGLKTGANAVFLEPPDDLEPDVIRFAVRGRDVRPFRVAGNVRLLWTHDAQGKPRGALPPKASAYITRHEGALRARADFADGPPWTVFRVAAAVARYRVVWADLARQLTAAPLIGPDGERVPLNTCYIASTGSARSAEILAAWLNSTWVRAVAGAGAVPAAGGFSRFTAAAVGGIPLPAAAMCDAALAALCRTARRGADVQANVQAGVQRELDRIAANHLGLAPRDRTALRSLLRAGPSSPDCRRVARRGP